MPHRSALPRSMLWLALPALAALSACAVPPTGASASPPLWGTEWRLDDLAGRAVLGQPAATLAFPEAGRAAGHGSCNRFFGSVQVEGSQIGFGQMGATRMACMGPVGEQEDRYLKALADAQRYEVRGRTLLIHLKGQDKPLRFTQTKP